MPEFIVTYDVRTPHQAEVRENLMKADFYFFTMKGAGPDATRLPSTTARFRAESLPLAVGMFMRAASGSLGPSVITSYIVMELTKFAVDGETF